MNKIKFRVWCNNRNEYCYAAAYMQISSGKDFSVFFDDIGDWESSLNPSSDLILEQFTGKHDIACWKIFWGDVVTAHIKAQYKMTLEGTVIFDDDLSCWCVRNEAGLSPFYNLCDFKVIGNIHESEANSERA